jgi:hypothetical protein
MEKIHKMVNGSRQPILIVMPDLIRHLDPQYYQTVHKAAGFRPAPE